MALGFHAFLRTGELLKLTNEDINFSRGHGAVVVRKSKSGLRFNMDESVALHDRSLPRLWELCVLAGHTQPHHPIWTGSGSLFRKRFYEALESLHLGPLSFQPYSIRRGGATHAFATSMALDRVIIRGRWRSLSVARIYLEDGQAQLSQIKMCPRARCLVAKFNQGLPENLLA